MRLFSMYSGIGAFEKALENLKINYQLVGFSEIDKWAIESYCAIHNASIELNYGDINKIDEKELPDFDLMTYGFPCQSFSVAGKRLGFEDVERGNLFFKSMRIANYKKPKYLIAENVKGLVNHDKGETFKTVLETLEEIGYNNYYQVLNAKDYGMPQNRERIFIISIRKDIDNSKFEFPKPIELTTRLRDLLDDQVEEKYFLSDEYHNNFIYNLNNKTVEHLKAESKGSYDILGTTLGTKAKGTNSRHWVHDTNKTISTLSATDYKQPKQIIVKEATLKGYDIATEEDSINISFPKSKTRRDRVGKGVAQTLDTQCNQAVLQDYKIRKLTPLECWRLMGFEDEDYFKAKTRLEDTFYKGKDKSNSQMYKQAGNSIVVPVLEEIFRSLLNEADIL